MSDESKIDPKVARGCGVLLLGGGVGLFLLGLAAVIWAVRGLL